MQAGRHKKIFHPCLSQSRARSQGSKLWTAEATYLDPYLLSLRHILAGGLRKHSNMECEHSKQCLDCWATCYSLYFFSFKIESNPAGLKFQS